MEPVASSSRSVSTAGSISGSAETPTVTTPTPSVNGKERAVDAEAGTPASALNGLTSTVSSQDGGSSGPTEYHGQANELQRNAVDEAGINLLDHLYQRGFLNGEFADVQLYYRPDRPPFKLHSLILALSPTLSSLLQHPHAPQQAHEVFLPLNGHVEITDESLYIAVGCLYSSRAQGMVNASNAPAVLSAALLLQLPKLASYAAGLCKQSIDHIASPQEASFWVRSIEAAETKPSGSAFWPELKEALTHRLVSGLPESLHAFSTKGTTTQQMAEAQTILQHVYSALPFDLFKAILESSDLGAGEGNQLSDQTRFGLAKKCIMERKKLAGPSGLQQDYEETVVLAFGSSSAGGSNVNIVRKPKQSRKLWKVAA